MSDLPPEAYQDCFHPPSVPTQVFCLHCQEMYDSYLIEWREERRADGKYSGFWCCPTPGCGGAGFGFDIHPVDPDYIDPDGRDLGTWEYGDDDEEDWYDDELDEVVALDESEELNESDELPQGSDPACRETSELDFCCAGAPEEEPGFDIPLDDLLAQNDAAYVEPLTPRMMDEIERRLGWRDSPASPRNPADPSASDSTDQSAAQRKREWLDDDDIPY